MTLAAVATFAADEQIIKALPGETGASPDRWHGLFLEETTPEQAIQALGKKPASDQPNRLLIRRVDKWFAAGLRGKTLRRLAFREIQGFSHVDLYFHADKLVAIQLAPKEKMAPTILPDIYGISFKPVQSGAEKMFSGRAPVGYGLVAVSDRTVILAEVYESAFGSVMRRSTGVRDPDTGYYPGKVGSIQLISRTLEDRSALKHGADLLK
jgi:hypothetical protein